MPAPSPHNSLISVDDTFVYLRRHAVPLGVESVELSQLAGRVAAQDVRAQMTQPPFSASAMDGYAVKFDDMIKGAKLSVIGEAPAGAPFEGHVKSGQAVRIFTGGVIPSGADHVIIQEDVLREEDIINVHEDQPTARNIRRAGIDFKKGDRLIETGDVFGHLSPSVLAAANIDSVSVFKKPVVALFSNGDELREPGAALKQGEIINSNHYGLSSLIESWGGEPHYLGCAKDSEAAIKAMFKSGHQADIILPIGGASVGDYDYVKTAFANLGGQMVFEKIAVRPGKPTWFGTLGAQLVLGLPGNPASAIVTSRLFLKPLIAQMAGRRAQDDVYKARLAAPLPTNGARETYMRANMERRADAQLYVRAAPKQDSSLLRPFLKGHVLIKRAPHAPACEADALVEIIYIGAPQL